LVPSLREWLIKDQEAKQLVEAIVLAETKNVPQQVEKLEGLRLRTWANPMLHRIIENSGVDSKERLHASLALLPVDDGQVKYLYSRLLDAGPAELEVIRDALHPFRERLVERLWHQLEESAGTKHPLQAASALARYDASSHRWENVGGKVAEAMVTVNAVDLGFWLNALRPVGDRLTDALAALYRDRDRSETERNLASNLLENYATDQPQVLTDLLMDSGKDHFALWFVKLAGHQKAAVPLLKEEMGKSLSDTTEAEKDGLAERQARAAIALVRLGHANEIWPKLQHRPDPRLRSFIVNWLAPLGVNPSEIATELNRIQPVAKVIPADEQQFMDAVLFHPETSIRRALILALGTYRTGGLSPGEREPLIGKLLDLYRNDPDAGIHGAAAWALRQWGQQVKLQAADAELIKLKDLGDRRWFLNSQGQTFTVIEGPVEFHMGSPPTEPDRENKYETLHRRIIRRRFAIAAQEVSVEQYQGFMKQNPGVADLETDEYSPDQKGPRNGPSWYDAAAYCNWLSRQEGLPECYEPNPDGRYAAGMRIKPDALCLGGYRLPTEAEWEYACRAGAETSRFYGSNVNLLGRYAWYNETSQNHAWPCGSLLPNELGLFDMLGNVWEWCQDISRIYQPDRNKIIIDIISNYLYVDVTCPRLLRGGTFDFQPSGVRSADRVWDLPSYRSINNGFRPSRTYP
ncbi:MAG TPA: formylglycine-generating enzyme family protein, partial [Gemmataceae bacterium]|nr:formylglycine-generating enzyme family protein [Gemmataceae bacterium]